VNKFLSVLGQLILKGGQIVGLFAPAIEQVLPKSSGVVNTVSADLAQIANIVSDVEVAGQALKTPGPGKLTAAAPLVAQVILQSSMLAGHKVAQPDLFNQGATSIASGMADILNSLHPNGITTTNKQA